MRSIGLFAGLGMLAVGLVTVYFGLTSPSEWVLFGVDSLLVIGGLQIASGVFFLVETYVFRSRVLPRNSE